MICQHCFRCPECCLTGPCSWPDDNAAKKPKIVAEQVQIEIKEPELTDDNQKLEQENADEEKELLDFIMLLEAAIVVLLEHHPLLQMPRSLTTEIDSMVQHEI